MILKDLGMLASINPRSKAYLQIMGKNGYIPNFILILDDEKSFKDEFKSTSTFGFGKTFNPHEELLQTIRNLQISYEFCSTCDPNDALVVSMLKERNEKYFVYSGPGGKILRKEILTVGKKFIHMHPGSIPEYKGSTTIYYSILKEGRCGVTAFFMNEEIDRGEIIKMKKLDKPKPGEDIDYYYDCSIRAAILKEILDVYVSKDEFPRETLLQNANEETYFIIHPVLKHVAILECQKEDE
mgnify:CR=1 FL=1